MEQSSQSRAQGYVAMGGIYLVLSGFLIVTWIATSNVWVLLLAGAIGIAGLTALVVGLRRLSRGKAERRAAAPAPVPVASPVASPVARAPHEEILGIDAGVLEHLAKQTPRSADLTYHFVCSGNESLVKAFYDLFRVGAPAYGGFAARYVAPEDGLSPAEDAPAFDGEKHLVTTVTPAEGTADVLRGIGRVGYRGTHVALAAVGPTGVSWASDTYTTLLGDAVSQGILPGPMYVTRSTAAARYVADALTRLEGEELPAEPVAAPTPSEGFQLVSGHQVDALLVQDGYSPDSAAGVLVRSPSGAAVPREITVTGDLVCPGCGTQASMVAQLYPGMVGGAGRVSCATCGSQITMDYFPESDEQGSAWLLVAHPLSGPVGPPKARIEILHAVAVGS